jgi:iron complex outermembrane receptor protein
VDLSGSYNLTTGFGTWTFAGTFTRILHNDLSVVPGARSIEALDIMNFPVSRRGRASVNWSLGGWTASVAANYLGSYTNNLPITVNGVLRPVSKIPAWTTVDALISYAIREGGPFGRWGQGVRLSLNMRNLLDKDPPLVLSANGNAMDVQNANPFGRIVTFQVTKAF